MKTAKVRKKRKSSARDLSMQGIHLRSALFWHFPKRRKAMFGMSIKSRP